MNVGATVRCEVLDGGNLHVGVVAQRSELLQFGDRQVVYLPVKDDVVRGDGGLQGRLRQGFLGDFKDPLTGSSLGHSQDVEPRLQGAVADREGRRRQVEGAAQVFLGLRV